MVRQLVSRSRRLLTAILNLFALALCLLPLLTDSASAAAVGLPSPAPIPHQTTATAPSAGPGLALNDRIGSSGAAGRPVTHAPLLDPDPLYWVVVEGPHEINPIAYAETTAFESTFPYGDTTVLVSEKTSDQAIADLLQGHIVDVVLSTRCAQNTDPGGLYTWSDVDCWPIGKGGVLYLLTIGWSVNYKTDARWADFVNYVLSVTGQGIVAQQGYVPLDSPQSIPDWDITMDRITNINDIVTIGQWWLQTNPGHPGWVRADINRDESVDINDIATVGQHWQQTWSLWTDAKATVLGYALYNVIGTGPDQNRGVYAFIQTSDPVLGAQDAKSVYHRVIARRPSLDPELDSWIEVGFQKNFADGNCPRAFLTYQVPGGQRIPVYLSGCLPIGVSYNYQLEAAGPGSTAWNVYWDDLGSPKNTIDMGWYPATEWASGAENGALTNKIGDSQYNSVRWWNPTDSVWYNASGYQVYDNRPENMSLGPGTNGSSWRAWAR